MAKFFASSNSPSMAVAVLLLGFLMASLTTTGAQSIGVCYGRNGDNLPSPAEVVALYRQQNIGRMRIYDPAQEVLQALRGSNIELIVDVPNPNLQNLASDASAAARWVETNVKSYPDVRIKYIAVGNEVSAAGNQQYVPSVLPAMQNIYNAIVAAGLQDQIKVSTAIDTGVVASPGFPPSSSVFTDQASSFLVPIIRFLADNGRAPLLANIYPYFAIRGDANLKLSYGLFTNSEPEFTDNGNGLVYQNLFDAQLDGVYAALEKAGGSGLEIVVSESGWPSAGDREATVDNAQKYNQNLINHVGKGSPKTGRPIETYVFAMFNENKKDAGIEQNFGLFNPDQRPVYQINFSS